MAISVFSKEFVSSAQLVVIRVIVFMRPSNNKPTANEELNNKNSDEMRINERQE